jgi:hypothetical protein
MSCSFCTPTNVRSVYPKLQSKTYGIFVLIQSYFCCCVELRVAVASNYSQDFKISEPLVEKSILRITGISADTVLRTRLELRTIQSTPDSDVPAATVRTTH